MSAARASRRVARATEADRRGEAASAGGRALILGRFQPPHKGHESLFVETAKRHEPVVVIGSAQESHTLANPFTASERYEMVLAVLQARGVAGHVVPVPDIHRHALWVGHVESLVPRFEAVVTNNPLTEQLFGDAGYGIVRPPLLHRDRFSATNVRRLMIEGGAWEDLVPGEVAALVRGFKGAERLRNLARMAEGSE